MYSGALLIMIGIKQPEGWENAIISDAKPSQWCVIFYAVSSDNAQA